MAIHSKRFGLALDRLGPGDWERFEQLASTFLAAEYPSLRTMASASGDGGRDSELFSEESDDSVVFQYSVTTGWLSKIRKTIQRLGKTFPLARSLIYVTNKQIGADADVVKKELRRTGYFLDVYDKSWFVERANSNAAREAAAEELAETFVDPLVSKKTLDNDLVSSLTGEDAKTALVFIEMQIQDSSSSYGLTKSSYDALTRAALRSTNTGNRLGRKQIVAKVHSYLPSHAETIVNQRVNAALERLSKSAIRHRKDKDEFHLLDSEIVRVAGSIAALADLKTAFDNDVLRELTTVKTITIARPSSFTKSARTIVETYFLRKGEDFARSAVVAIPHTYDEITLRSIVSSHSVLDFGISGDSKVAVMTEVLQSVLGSPTEDTAAYLKNLLESYTLFAFLAATPDVQRATRDMFGSGEIWLDTSVILPLLSEYRAPTSQTTFSQIFQQAASAGLRLLVTAGVLEEVERHINKCMTFLRRNVWNGPVPYLLAAFLRFGGTERSFTPWVENFAGDSDPIQDIADYLRSNHNIRLESAADHPNVSDDLASAITAEWQRLHIERRDATSGDTVHAIRLANHDAENYLHVLSSRIGQRGKAPLGYSDWWLTLDRSARSVMSKIDESLRPAINIGPVLSLDYLLRYLAFGPNRERVDLSGVALAKVYADALIEPLPVEMIEMLEGVRADNVDVPEAIVQRRIRDRLNEERSRLGEIDANSLDQVNDALRNAY